MLTIQRVRFYGVLLGLFTLANLAAAFVPTGIGAIDWDAQITAGTIARQGEMARLYDFGLQEQVGRAIESTAFVTLNPFQSPPVVAFLYLPFTLIPRLAGLIVWDLISLGLVYTSLGLLLSELSGVQKFGRCWTRLLILLSWPFLDLILIGQDTALSFALYAGGIALLIRRRDTLAGAVLGLGVFKPQLFLMVPVVLVVRRSWRAFGAFAAVASVLAGLSVGLVGSKGVQAYLALVGSDAVLASAYIGKMQTVPAVLRLLLPPRLVFLETLICLAIAAALVFWLAPRFEAVGQLAVAILATELTSTHLFFYDTLLLAIPSLWLLNWNASLPRTRWSVAATYLLIASEPFRSALFVRSGLPLALLSGPFVALGIGAMLISALSVPAARSSAPALPAVAS